MRWLWSLAYAALAVVSQYHPALAADKFLGIILPGPGSEYTDRLLLGAQRASRDLGIDVKHTFVAPTDNRDRQTSFLQEIIAERPAGIIIAPNASPGIEKTLREISELPVVVGVGPVGQEAGQLPTVMTNNFVAGALAADLLGSRAGEDEGIVAWIGSNDTGERAARGWFRSVDSQTIS
jgi:ribose transport system substrate-binding protein